MNATQKLAVLIDADNAQPSLAGPLLAEIAKYGTANVKRIYGDWTHTRLKGWKDVLLPHSIQPIQQFGYTKGKNSTDSALIIDAMDLLYSGKFDGFCIVSSDSDFTKLASRIRESGLTVYGFGERHTPEPFVAACDKFIYNEVLVAKSDEEEEDSHSGSGVIKRKNGAELRQDRRLVQLLRSAVTGAADDGGWAELGSVGSNIAKQSPDFDSRNYGYARLSGLVAATNLFEVDERPGRGGQHTAVYLKMKQRGERRADSPGTEQAGNRHAPPAKPARPPQAAAAARPPQAPAAARTRPPRRKPGKALPKQDASGSQPATPEE
jgi:uncharacterized LabA/DUF88 family protein